MTTLWSSSDSFRAGARRLLPLFALSVGIWLWMRFWGGLHWDEVARDVESAGAGVCLVFMAPIVGNVVHMCGWRALLPSELRPGFWRALRIFLAAQAGNEVGLGLLGESIKVAAFPSAQRAATVKAVLLDNLTALVALIAVVLSVASFLGGTAVHDALPRLLGLGAIAVLAAGLVGVFVFRKRALSSAGSVRSLLFACLAHYLGKLWILAEFALALALFDAASLRSAAVLGLVSTLASVVGAPIPGQLGVVECALEGSAAAAGVGAGTLGTVALLRRVRSLVWISVGGLLACDLPWTAAKRRLHASTSTGD